MKYKPGSSSPRTARPANPGILWVFLVALFFLQAARAETITGRLSVVWGDPRPGCAGPEARRMWLTDDSGKIFRLVADSARARGAGSMIPFTGQRVAVEGTRQEPSTEGTPDATFRFTGFRQLEAADPVSRDVTGSQPWVSILLKFSDVAAEPNDLSFFQNMYSASYPGLDHFWQENSGNLINLAGSAAYGWYTLPHPRSYYITGDPATANLTALFNDGTAAADPYVNFSLYVGINLMFNDLLDCCAWGGNRYTTLDGQFRQWRVTWEPPWGYQKIAVIAHETGHGFGLPHSSGEYGQTYDNFWDVMSNLSLCAVTDPIYGCVGQHTILHHKNMLGWVGADRRITVGAGGQRTLTLERNSQPSTTNLRVILLPVNGSNTNFLTVEARRWVGYDLQLPGEAVIIHEVDTLREIQAHVIDIDGNGATGDAGAMWLPGETHNHPTGSISVIVNAATATGWIVTVKNQPPADPNGDVNGDTLANSADLATIQNVLAGNFAAGAYPCTLPEMGDFNDNDAIDSVDCLILADSFAGN